ncbi:YALI0F01496p [Yarrowia lipolytica CLIB122]|uniref:Thioredoxin n=2 Tax=Yarrowia lipolytica TaxID=4952 RepID=Q6C399_YARLI|nr:YALI0F01496p [Yarrowia lipolytica CLIB122]KAJ8056255.1 thioredoxin-like protein [Yarrowia lipolytica]QNQ00480.1 Thioredoxin-2 [Yarrowia lipolytica]CAG77665.1 YALI0F01496p [Yarrowia lipolytica CLIB122]SEI32656.1 YALIA101S02e22606g1_1 [Yarrowia lipolytica]VBB83466.1 Cytoplasmic thioredoxin isoenzyme, putative [Yarrowia lipolytica]|eukprot:XP_504863.1 YALI0F01496p [Yarrowia lipolytica CLIB122]
MAVTQITSVSDFQNAIKSDKLTVIDFYATWCGPCKMIAPTFDKFSETFTDAQFYRCDVDEASAVAQEVGVTAMPTFAFYKNGEKITTVMGANPSALNAAIKQNV